MYVMGLSINRWRWWYHVIDKNVINWDISDGDDEDDDDDDDYDDGDGDGNG